MAPRTFQVPERGPVGLGLPPRPVETPPQSAPSSPEPWRAQPAAPDTAVSVLGADLKIRGEIEGRGQIQLQGRAWGDVRVERLVVTEAAELEGSVLADAVEVRGRVVGSIGARSVRLLQTARVEGDITYEQLEIEMGAKFEGRCIRTQPAQELAAVAPVATPEPEPLPAEI